MGDSVSERTLGPERCCSSLCREAGKKCGGRMDFSGGGTVKCYSVYCVPGEEEEGGGDGQAPDGEETGGETRVSCN